MKTANSNNNINEKNNKKNKKNKSSFLKFFKRFRFRSILFKNFMFYTVIVLIPVLFFSVLYYNDVKKTLFKEINDMNIKTVNSVSDMTDTIIYELWQFVYKTSTDNSVLIFSASKNPQFNNYRLWEKIEENNLLFKNIYDYIDSIYVYSDFSKSIIVDNEYTELEGFYDTEWLNVYESLKPDEIKAYLRNKTNSWRNIMTVMRPISVNQKKIGAVLVNVDLEKLSAVKNFENASSEAGGLIVSESGEIRFSKIPGLFNKNINSVSEGEVFSLINEKKVVIDDNEYMVFLKKSQSAEMYYLYLHSWANYEAQADRIKYKAVLFVFICVALGLLLAVSMTYYSIRPINNIIEFIEKNESGNSNAVLTSKDELNYIIDYSRRIIYEKNEMNDKLIKNNINLKKAYHLALQSQINPHFLSNTLETINWNAVILWGGENQISSMIGNLGKIYTYLLKSQNFLVTLYEEISYTKLYAEILEIRYKEKFDILWDIDENMLNCKIIKLSLQPILENAVYHGIKPILRKGKIIFNGRFVRNEQTGEEDICIKIIDNGVGMTDEKLEEIKKVLKSSFDIFDEHIGIANVSQRMKMVYSEPYGLSIDKNEKDGICITLLLPKEK